MIIKKSKISLALIFMTAVPLAAFSADNSKSLNVTISGSIASEACTAQVPPTLTLGNINESDLTDSVNAGESISKTNMHITFVDCEVGQEIQVGILGTADTADSSVMANAIGPEKSQNVGLAFLDQTGALMAINTGKSPIVVATDGNATLDLDAIVVKADSAQVVTPGQADFNGQVKIDFL